MNDGPTICKECGSPITQLGGGHRRREYCDDNCKQAAYRARQEEKRKVEVRQRWTGYSEQTQNQLEWLMNKYGCDFAKMVAGLICTERAYVPQSSVANKVLQEHGRELEQQISNLEQQLVRYRQVVDLDDRTHLEQQLLDIGEQIGYRQFIPADHLVAVGSGLDFWRSFAAGADDETLVQAVNRARHYAENLVAIDAQMEVNKARRRIAELEHQVEHNRLLAVSS